MNGSGRRRSAGADDRGAIGTACQRRNRDFGTSRIEHELLRVTVRVRKFDPFPNGKAKHSVARRKVSRIEQHLDWPDIVRLNPKTLLAFINYTRSIDSNILEVVEDFLAFEAVTNAAGQAIRREPDRS